jgi:site-specific DNA-methyltransferase (adenine-specific)
MFEYMFILSKGKPKTFNPLKEKCKWFGLDSDRTGQKLGTHDEKMKRARSGNDRTNIKEYKIKGNIWHYQTGFNHSSSDRIAFSHPAIFPEKLAADQIYSWSNEGNIVYDPFTGSGTTLKMAFLANRNFLGSELSEEYFNIATQRLNPFLSQHKLL